MDIVFGTKWFERHQRKLLFLLNAPIIKIWFRWILRIKTIDCKTNEIISKISTNYFEFNPRKSIKINSQTFRNSYRGEHAKILHRRDKNKYRKQGIKYVDIFDRDVRTHNKFSKRMYFAFKPIWYFMHAWDLIFTQKYIPQLNFGFDTLTVYPNPHTETVSFDGYCTNDQTTWASARSGTASSGANDDITQGVFVQNRKISDSQWIVNRAFFLFDATALDDGVSISATDFGVVPHDAAGSTLTDTMTLRIVSSTPASNTAIATGDFDQIGATVFASMLASSYVGTGSSYNIFSLDANGIANVSKTVVSKFAAVGSMDIDNVTPTGNNQVLCRYADYAGTSTDPKILITYSTPSGPANMKSYNTNLKANVKSINTNLIANIKSLNTNV